MNQPGLPGVPLLRGLFWIQFILTAFHGSFLPYTMMGLAHHVCGLLLLFTWIIAGFLGRGPWLRAAGSTVTLLFLGLAVSQTLSIHKADTPSLSLDFMEGRFWVLVLAVIVHDLKDDPDFREDLRRSWHFLAFATACYGFYQVYVGLPELRESLLRSGQAFSGSVLAERFNARLQSDEMFGTYLYSNLFGSFCAMAVLTLPLLLPRDGGLSRGFWLSSGGLLAFALYQSRSKGAMLGLAIAAGAAAAAWAWARGRRGLCLALAAGLVAAVLLLFIGPFSGLCRDSLEVRAGYWASALAMVREHPLGVGIANFGEEYPSCMTETATEVKQAHNDHLQQFVELGFLGFLLYAAFLAVLVRACWRHLCAGPPPEREGAGQARRGGAFPWAGGVALGVLFLLCQVLQNGPMDVGHLGGLLWMALLAGFMLVATSSPPAPRPLFRAVPLALAVFFIVHGSVDFVFYDHSLVALWLVLILGLLDGERHDWHLSRGARLLLIVLVLGVVYLLTERYLAVFPVSRLDQPVPPSAEEVQGLLALARSRPRELAPWDALLRTMERVPEILNSREARAAYLEVLDGALSNRPHSAALCLRKARLTADPRQAEALHLRALRAYPRHPRYALHYAVFLARTSRHAEAREWSERARRLHAEAARKAATKDDFRLLMLKDGELQLLEGFNRNQVL